MQGKKLLADLLIPSLNGDRNIQSIRITIRPMTRIRVGYQSSLFRRTSINLIPIEET